MRATFLFSFLIISTFSFSQIFNFETEWFDNMSFFESSFIQSKKIKTIHVTVSEKQDGYRFQTESSLLHYEYNENGQLIRSYKFIPLKNRIDTAMLGFSYNSDNTIYKRVEKQGLFNFDYYFFYKNGFRQKEIKIDAHTKDTSYLRYFETIITGSEEQITALNSIQKPFLRTTKKRKGGHLVNVKTSYIRNQNYTSSSFSFVDNKLERKETIRSFGKKQKTSSLLSYENDMLSLIRVFKDGKHIKKLAFTFSENGLPKEIIEREIEEKKIIIYRLNYTFRN